MSSTLHYSTTKVAALFLLALSFLPSQPGMSLRASVEGLDTIIEERAVIPPRTVPATPKRTTKSQTSGKAKIETRPRKGTPNDSATNFKPINTPITDYAVKPIETSTEP